MNGLALRPGGTGVQTYIRELVRAMARADRVDIAVVVQADAAAELPPGVEARVRPVAAGVRRAIEGLRSLGPADLVHGLDVDLPRRSTVPTVATVHDLSVFDVPWAFSKRRATAERAIVSASLRRADAIIAVSAFTAERALALVGREATVVHEAPSPAFAQPDAAAVERVRAAYGLPAVFVFHVGTVEPRKDIASLAAAARLAGLPLVLAGAIPDVRLVPPGVRALGYVPFADLAALYGAATVVAYPSRYEGFGLPPLEAMACGAPVVASAVTSLPEVLGDGAELVAAGDVDAWASALGRLAADDEARRELAARGRRRAASFTWDATAAATLEVYAGLGISV
ncbi:MAG: hypothetical protein QOG03_2040 [Actinomycetota bacterium]|jgi:glycosyltransferase involved in cell wall biosynthesis|nr:hypothetical protein [Actinomycetota bacterium]